MPRLSLRLIGSLILLSTWLGESSIRADDRPNDRPRSPVTPEESLRWFELDSDFRIELVASEPQVVDPVAVQFDERGRMWVVEMRDYPNGPAESERPKSRIKLLEDLDADGRFEKVTVFADELLFATGVQPYRDGAVVTVGGKVVFFRDTDDDGKADLQEAWLQGLAEQNPQLRGNDPTIALDLKLYIANGLRSQSIENAGDKLRTTQLDVRNRDIQVDLRSGAVATITGPSQFGMTWDRFGNRYFCSNRNPCDGVLIEQEDASLSPLSGLAPMTAPIVPAGEASKVHPLTEGWTTSNLHAGQFSAACGVLLSASDHLLSKDELSNITELGYAFTCEPTGNLVHRRKLKRVNGTSQVADPEPSKDFLAGRDAWFRPVNLCEGPDGAVYVVDMYRAVIEHPQFMPDELKNRPDLRLGDDRGRIYRISRKNSSPSARFNPSPDSWVAELSHANEWHRATAARLLSSIDKPKAETLPEVIELGKNGPSIESRLRAVYLLANWNAVDLELVQGWLNDKELPIRRTAWRLSTSMTESKNLESILRPAWQALTPASDLDERLTACWSLAKLDRSKPGLSEEFRSRIATQCAAWVSQEPTQASLWMACSAAAGEKLPAFTSRVVSSLLDQPPERFADEAAALPPMSSAIERLVQAVAKPEQPDWKALETTLSAAMNPVGLSDPQKLHRLGIVAAVVAGWARSDDRDSIVKNPMTWRFLSELATVDSIPTKTRSLVISTLAFGPKTAVVDSLRSLAEGTNVEPAVYSAAVRAWSKHADPTLDDWLVDHFQRSTLKRREELFMAVMGAESRAARFVAALEGGAVSLKELGPSQLQSLKSIRFAALKSRVAALLAKSIDANREKVIAEYASCLEMKADMQRGREVFAKQCASCHKLEAVGMNVGPDISDSRKYTPSQILTSILDPNRAIDNNYFRFVALTTDGEVCEGILAEETGKTITLRGQNDKVRVLERSELESIKSAGVSLMPEGLEAQIPKQAMADLIHYIKNWRYTDGRIPGTVP